MTASNSPSPSNLPSTTADEHSLFEKTYLVPACAPDRVFDAITNPVHMRRWLAQGVAVEPRAGGRFAFWGRSIPWCSSDAEANQRFTSIDPPLSLAFSWHWRNCRSNARLSLSTAAGDTSLSVRHEGRGSLLDRPNETGFFLADFWRLAAGNLIQYLRTGEPALIPDFLDPRPGVTLSIVIDAPIERIFSALTDPAMMDRWIATGAKVNARPQGEYSYGWKMQPGDAREIECVGPTRILEIDPPRRLVTDWVYRGDPGVSRVTWELDPISPGSTRLTLTHLGIGEEPANKRGYIGGWTAFAIELKHFMEFGIAPR